MIGAELIGTPYRLGGRDPKTGLDCFGLVVALYRLRGIRIADIAEHLSGGEWQQINSPDSYDLVLLGNAHCGLYIPCGRLLHTTAETGAVLAPLTAYRPMISGYYHYVGGNND